MISDHEQLTIYLENGGLLTSRGVPTLYDEECRQGCPNHVMNQALVIWRKVILPSISAIL
jgi:hypothetical protein